MPLSWIEIKDRVLRVIFLFERDQAPTSLLPAGRQKHAPRKRKAVAP